MTPKPHLFKRDGRWCCCVREWHSNLIDSDRSTLFRIVRKPLRWLPSQNFPYTEHPHACIALAMWNKALNNCVLRAAEYDQLMARLHG